MDIPENLATLDPQYEDIQNKKHNTLCVGTPLYARLKKKTYKAKSTTHYVLDTTIKMSLLMAEWMVKITWDIE
jgi:hypothetical protein